MAPKLPKSALKCQILFIYIFRLEISEEKSRNQTLEQELMEAKITIQELRKHQLQPQESYYQNHSNQYESDSISGRSTPEPKPIIGKTHGRSAPVCVQIPSESTGVEPTFRFEDVLSGR